jgi:cytochrome P450
MYKVLMRLIFEQVPEDTQVTWGRAKAILRELATAKETAEAHFRPAADPESINLALEGAIKNVYSLKGVPRELDQMVLDLPTFARRHNEQDKDDQPVVLNPSEHTRLRTIVNRAFVSGQIERFRPQIATLAHELIDGFAAQGSAELLSAFADIIPVTIIARLLGVPEAMGPQLLRWSHDYVRMYMFGHTHADELAANHAAAEFAAYVRGLIDQRRSQPQDDLISSMIRNDRAGPPMTDDELVSTIIVLLNAGHEATVHQIGNAVTTILDSGLDPATLFADEAATQATVEECLRICAPVHIFSRYALQDVPLADGVEIKKGQSIGLILAAANLDPQQFTEPLRFWPQRDQGSNLSFGAGIHFCIGAPLARLELQIALPILFACLPGLRLAKRPVVKDVYHFHGLERVEVVWGEGRA